MIFERKTSMELLTYLLKLSADKGTTLTINDIREVLGLEGNVGVKTLDLIVPELKFSPCVYKGVSYIKIKPKAGKLKTFISVAREGVKDEN
jgi:hypothetical protein